MAILAISCLLAGKISYSKLEPSDKPVIEQLKEKWEEAKTFLEVNGKKGVDLTIDAGEAASNTAGRVVDFFNELSGKEEAEEPKGEWRQDTPAGRAYFVSQEQLDKEKAEAEGLASSKEIDPLPEKKSN